tara:strand:- start:662 stop:1099 length:438 start_codon:yes stop_codon:yes gene_type:complete
MSQYDVGTVLWIIHRDRPGLVAYRVVEEITKKTLEGEKIQYLVQPAIPKSSTVQLESIKGRIFLTPEEAKQALIENATRAIDAMIEKTQNLVNKIFFVTQTPNTVSKKITQQLTSQTQSELKSGYQWVEMEDGQKIQVKIPESLL